MNYFEYYVHQITEVLEVSKEMEKAPLRIFEAICLISLFGFSYAGSEKISFPLSSSERQIDSQVLECNSSDRIIQTICELALNAINNELQKTGIRITQNDFLYSIHDENVEKIDTGHSCTVRAELRSRKSIVTLSRDSKIDFSFDSVSEPITLAVELPVSYYEEYVIRQRAGVRVLGGCSTLGRDTYKLYGEVSTTAQISISLDLNPTFKVLSLNEYLLKINPKAIVLFNLDDINIDFKSSGLSPITKIWNFVVGLSSTKLKVITSLFKGDGVRESFDIIKSSIGTDVGSPLLLTLS